MGGSSLRVDTTAVSDPYAFYLSNDRVQGAATGATEPPNDSGKLVLAAIDPVNFVTTTPFWYINPLSVFEAGLVLGLPDGTPFINLLADPFAPFADDAVTI